MKFDEFKELALDTAAIAAQKTKDLAAIGKAKVSIQIEKDKIRKAYTELGKLYYRDYVLNEEMDDAEYLPWCDKITECKAVIEDLKALITDIKASDPAAAEEVEAEESDFESGK